MKLINVIYPSVSGFFAGGLVVGQQNNTVNTENTSNCSARLSLNTPSLQKTFFNPYTFQLNSYYTQFSALVCNLFFFPSLFLAFLKKAPSQSWLITSYQVHLVLPLR